ncbi:MAG: hypothetical protein HOK06_07350 [Rhodospirillaceae bacterium]|nr:hypothetical protein [Rhodospirillaceae bacterium]MBT6407403.1 hypothetical protein [Rhodospirillaceae bacterium]
MITPDDDDNDNAENEIASQQEHFFQGLKFNFGMRAVRGDFFSWHGHKKNRSNFFASRRCVIVSVSQ